MGQDCPEVTSMGGALQACAQGILDTTHHGDGGQKQRTSQDNLFLAPDGDEWTLADLQRKLKTTDWFQITAKRA